MDDLPIRVLHVLGSMQRGGTESVVFNNYQYIDRSRVQFDIAVDDNSPCDIPQSIADMGCRVYRIPPYTKQPAYIAAIMRLCRENQYLIIHSHMNAMSMFSLFAAWAVKVPVRIAHSHSTAAKGRGETTRNLLMYMLKPFSKVFATHCFACSEQAARWLFGSRVVDNGKAVILNNAIPVRKFCFDPDRREKIRGKLGIKDKFVIGNVGRFSPQKNHLFLIDVFYEITKKRRDAQLLLVGGTGSAGSGIEHDLKVKIEKYGIEDRVIFLGSAEDISGFYQVMDVFVLPSLYEGFGIACIEAQCSGLPCVLSDRVPKVTRINRNVKYLPLGEPLEKWTHEIMDSQGIRGDYSEAVAAAGYDIRNEAKRLEKVYIEYAQEAVGSV